MLLKLTEAQLQWVLENTGFGENVISMFRDHYVNGYSKNDAAHRNGLSLPFASKKRVRFELLMIEKCKENGLEISTILHSVGDKKAVYSFDIPSSQKKKET